MRTKAFHPQTTMNKASRVFFMSLVCLAASLLASKSFGASLKKVTGKAGSPSYDAAVNQNFERINNELSNTVHKTSTETVVGAKYFSGRLEATAHFIPPQASDIDDAITPLKIGEIYFNTTGFEWCGSTATNSGAWVKVHAPTTPCAN